MCAVVSGANGWSDIEEFGHAKLDWLRRYVPLVNGVPVDDTIARIISALSVTGFQKCFRSWIDDVVTLSAGEIVAVDGKTHRQTTSKRQASKPSSQQATEQASKQASKQANIQPIGRATREEQISKRATDQTDRP